MDSVDHHFQLTNLLKSKLDQDRWLKKAFDQNLPVAINAYGIFVHRATVLPDGRMAVTGEVRMMKRGWLYIDPDALLGFLSHDSIEVGMFRSGPDAELDTWATRKAGSKIHISRNELWVHEDLLPISDDSIKTNTTPDIVATNQDNSSRTIETERRKQEKEAEIDEIRKMAVDVATNLKKGGMAPKYITQKRICEDLLEKSFSSGKPVRNRWGSIEGIRSHLKGGHCPKKSNKFRNAKSERRTFNA